MASHSPEKIPSNQFIQFDYVAKQIHQTFDPLIAELMARRDVLLLRLSDLQVDYTIKETTRKAAIEEIEKTQQHMQQLSLRENRNLPIHSQATELYKQGLQNLMAPTKVPGILFECPTLYELRSLISKLGILVESVDPDYTLKKKPILSVGKRGNREDELEAAGLAIDEDDQLLYVSDCINKRVQIISFEGDFIDRFGQDTLKFPWGIAVNKEYVFITDPGQHALLQFDRNSHQLVRRAGIEGSKDEQFSSPNGLCIGHNGGVVLVADNGNNRVSVFSGDLQFISNFGNGILEKPTDVDLTHDSVAVVLDCGPKCAHFFSQNGQFLRSCISRGDGPDCLVTNALFFCIDPAGNLIISDFYNHAIKIVSQSEQLIHTLGRKGEGRGDFIQPVGTCISNLGTIFVISQNPSYTLQAF